MSLINLKQIASRVGEARRLAGPDPWVVGYDVASVQELVTANGRPTALRGASEALKAFDDAQDKRRDSSGASVFCAGGRGLLLCQGEAYARALLSSLAASFKEKAIFGTLATAAVPLGRGGEGACLRALSRALERARDEAAPPPPELPTGREDTCTDCGIWRGIHKERSGEGEDRLLCRRCNGFMERGRRYSEERGQKELSTNDIAGGSSIAALSADGNHMGALFESMTDFETTAAVSAWVSGLFGEAHRETCMAVFGGAKAAYLDPILGGDDIRLLLPPPLAFDYALGLTRRIEEGTRDLGELGTLLKAKAPGALTAVSKIGIGIGVVVCPAQSPIRQVFDAAHALEGNAKRRCRGAGGARSAIDYAFVTTADFDVLGRRAGRGAGAAAVEERDRPLAMDDLPRALEWARALGQLPHSQLALLRERGRLEEAEFFNLLRYQVARNSAWQSYYAACGLDWRVPTHVEQGAPSQARVEMLRILKAGAAAGKDTP